MNPGIFYTDTGTGLPVIFIHGYCETHRVWDYAIPQLSRSFRVVAIDLPGFGKSPLPESGFSLADIASMTHDLLARLGITGPVMIGHSLGGYMTLAYTGKYRGELKGLGLFHSTAYADTPDKKQNRTRLIDFIGINGTESFLRTFIPSLFYDGKISEYRNIINKLTAEASGTPAKTIQEYARAMRDREEHTDILSTFPGPVMMIIGRNDNSVPFEKSREQAQLIKDPHVLTLDETAHMGMYEKPEETLSHLQRFLEVCQKKAPDTGALNL